MSDLLELAKEVIALYRQWEKFPTPQNKTRLDNFLLTTESELQDVERRLREARAQTRHRI